MLAHKHCELFVTHCGSVINSVGNGPGQFLESYEASWLQTPISPVMKLGIRHPRREERN